MGYWGYVMSRSVTEEVLIPEQVLDRHMCTVIAMPLTKTDGTKIKQSTSSKTVRYIPLNYFPH
jgi:hypothetical protein